MRYYLIDNGSLRAASYSNLRRVARELGAAVGEEILPVSLLHSNRIPEAELDGHRALTWEPQLKADLEAGFKEFCIIPFFFGPTGAILDYLPRRLSVLRERYGPFQVERTPFVFESEASGSFDLLDILIARIREQRRSEGWERPYVVFVDHGSPQPDVVRIRDFMAGQLSMALKDEVAGVLPASMERREGDEYRFADPLLETVLRDESVPFKQVIISLLFLSPGKHAGPDGDVAGICREAETSRPGLQCAMTPLVGTHEKMVALLSRRFYAPRVWV